MPNNDNGFSWMHRFKSFTYAWSGIVLFLKTEHNARIHLALTIVVFILCFVLPVTNAEAMALIIVMAMVWITELLNTAIEKAMDFISSECKPQIKWVKDLAAAAVLVAAIAAVLIGVFIFIPKLF
jgi:diacylglycerol kinase (ATP)